MLIANFDGVCFTWNYFLPKCGKALAGISLGKDFPEHSVVELEVSHNQLGLEFHVKGDLCILIRFYDFS